MQTAFTLVSLDSALFVVYKICVNLCYSLASLWSYLVSYCLKIFHNFWNCFLPFRNCHSQIIFVTTTNFVLWYKLFRWPNLAWTKHINTWNKFCVTYIWKKGFHTVKTYHHPQHPSPSIDSNNHWPSGNAPYVY